MVFPKRTYSCDDHPNYVAGCVGCRARSRTYYRFVRKLKFTPCRASRKCGTCESIREKV